jgi:hypothetical protein
MTIHSRIRQEAQHPKPYTIAKRARQAEAKGRPPLRQCPPDFEVIFVEIGRVEVETWYRASRRTINRWLLERGKRKLINLRAAYVRRQRLMAAKGKPLPTAAAVNGREVDPDLARLAAEHLRRPRNGGWMVSQSKFGDWYVGIVRRSAEQMLEMAERKGFDVEAANLQLQAERAVG